MNIQSQIASAKAFLSAQKSKHNFERLVEFCSLKPIKDWKHWQDDASNKLTLSDKGVRISPSKHLAQQTTDIFAKSEPYRISDNSYWVMIVNLTRVCFLGNDGRLRVSNFDNDGVWKGNSLPLLLGLDLLHIVSTHYLDTYVKNVNGMWVGGWPNTELKGKIKCLTK